MFRIIHESVTFSQEIQEENNVTIPTVTIKSYNNTIDDITKAYIVFVRALDFMDCQIIDALEDCLDELKLRRTFETTRAQMSEDIEEEEDDDQPPTFSDNKEVTFSNDGIDMKYSFDKLYSF